MIDVMIIPSSKRIGGGWDVVDCKILSFRNLRKVLYFVRYYSKFHDVLIRVYINSNWTYTYCKGKEIWNCY